MKYAYIHQINKSVRVVGWSTSASNRELTSPERRLTTKSSRKLTDGDGGADTTATTYLAFR